MAAKKKTAKTKRPPREVWLCLPRPQDRASVPASAHPTMHEARDAMISGESVAGPYVLAERVRER